VAKKQKCPEFENHERWLVSYADMVTLLFAVFVVLYSLNMSGKKDEKVVAGSLQESFDKPLDDIPIDRRVGPQEQGWGIFDHFRGTSIRPSLIQKYPSSSQAVKIIDDEMNRVKIKLEERLYGPNKFREETKPGQERIVSVQRTTKGFKLQLLARHFFASGETHVNRQAMDELDSVVGILKDLGRPVRIEGHTDSVPASGAFGNWEISALRATNVLKYMVRKHNFPATMLSAAGFADLHPIASNNTESGRSLNRRIEIHIDYDTSTAADPE
jgi:chemotaxis protein MotB